jgi:lysophospholipase L1-like esterase
MPSAPTAKSPHSLGRKLTLLACVVVIGATFCEVAARIRLHMKYGRATTEIYASEFDPATGTSQPLPSQDYGFLHINALGFRGPEIPRDKPAGALRFAFLGGSTTFCAEASSDEATWPMLVAAALSKELGAPCDVVNAALPGIGIRELRRILDVRVKATRPDVIVIYEATNDLSRDTRKLADEQGLFIASGDERSALARISVAWDLIEKNLRVLARTRDAKSGQARLEYDADALARGFRTELEGLVREARAIAPVVVLVTFSTKMRASQTDAQRLASANTSLLYMPYMSTDGLLRGFEAYNRVIREVATAEGVVLVDGEDSIPADDQHFNDSVHFTDAGSAKQAQRVIERLSTITALRELATKR